MTIIQPQTDRPIVSRGGASVCAISVVIPTLNEADNIDLLLPEVLSATATLNAQIILADGGSTDGTQRRAQKWTEERRVRLVQCPGRGLAGDILFGAQEALGEIVVVMDGDLSHPPSVIPLLVGPLVGRAHDICIGTRYAAGGGTPGWPWSRRLASRSGAMLARPFTHVSDPMSGFFAVRRELLLRLGQDARGFKIALAVLTGGDAPLRVAQVPFVFRNRQHGRSKLGMREAAAYLAQVALLAKRFFRPQKRTGP